MKKIPICIPLLLITLLLLPSLALATTAQAQPMGPSEEPVGMIVDLIHAALSNDDNTVRWGAGILVIQILIFACWQRCKKKVLAYAGSMAPVVTRAVPATLTFASLVGAAMYAGTPFWQAAEASIQPSLAVLGIHSAWKAIPRNGKPNTTTSPPIPKDPTP